MDRSLLHQEIEAVDRLFQSGSLLSRDRLYNLLQRCIHLQELKSCRKLHIIMVCSGLDIISVLADHFIRFFSINGSLLEVSLTFCKVEKPTVYSWNAAISAYIGVDQEVIFNSLYKMDMDFIKPDRCTVLSLLQCCVCRLSCLSVHDYVIRNELASDKKVGNTLVHAYASNGSLIEARKVFDQLLQKDDVACGMIISAYADNGHELLAIELFFEFQKCGLNLGKATILGVLKAFSLDTIWKNGWHILHNLTIQCGFDTDLEISNSIIHLYGKHGFLLDAHRIFLLSVNPDVISWGALILGYVDYEHGGLHALQLYGKMLANRIEPSKVIFLCILKACSSLNRVIEGRLVHNHIMIYALESDVAIASSLIDMYGKCGSLDEGYEIFRKLKSCNAMTWGALISGHVQNGKYVLALKLVSKMQNEGIAPSIITSVHIMKACACTGEKRLGRFEHHRLIENGVLLDVVITSAMIDMYAKFGSLEDAKKLFHDFPKRNIVSWSSMIWGHVEHGNSVHALDLFQQMIMSGVFPDKVVCLCVLKACGNTGAICEGRWMHDQIVITNIDSDVAVGSAIIDMYAKSGHLEEARCVIDRLHNRNVMSWGALIAGYAQHGSLHQTSECINIMINQGLKPNHVIFSSILVACSHSGLLKEGHLFFRIMAEHHDVAPCIDHYASMLDLLSRSGYLKEASGFIQGMPMPPNVVMLTSMLTNCVAHNSVNLARQHFEHIVQINFQTALENERMPS